MRQPRSQQPLIDGRYPALIDAAMNRRPVFESLESGMLLSSSPGGGVNHCRFSG
jgi:hypothetical protein